MRYVGIRGRKSWWLGGWFAVLALITGRESVAIDANPAVLTLEQPDKTKLALRLRGNEYFHWYEDLDGNAVATNESGQFCYARRAAGAARLTATDVVLGAGKRAPKEALRTLAVQQLGQTYLESLKEPNAPVRIAPSHTPDPGRIAAVGDVSNCVILMKFSNHTARPLPSRNDYDVIFNKPGGDPDLAPTGSVRDVYLENSYNELRLNSTVFDWVNLPRSEQYYADGDSGGTSVIWEAIVAALDQADDQIDFREFDKNNDKIIDAIAFIHSGYGAEVGGVDVDGQGVNDRIWSHKWRLGTVWESAEGIQVRDYHINPGLWGLSGKEPTHIGVICHETGHFFGIDDFYDTSGGASGIGSWGLMGNSWGFQGQQRFPPHFSAYSKVALEWVKVETLTEPGIYEVPQAQTEGAIVYKLSDGYRDGEYLLIENRQPVGFDQKIPAGGLAIWHIDEAKPRNDEPGHPGQPGWPENNRHYRIALLQADGDYDLEKFRGPGDDGDLFRKGHVDELGPTTVPNTDGYQGGDVVQTGHRIWAISEAGPIMSFRFGADDTEPPILPPSNCCPVTASNGFSVDDGIERSSPSKLLEATIVLEKTSDVHIHAETSARSSAAGVELITGLLDEDDLSTVWARSYRQTTWSSASESRHFGTSMTVTLPPGRHTIYWSVWISGGSLSFDSGMLTVVGYPTQDAGPGGIIGGDAIDSSAARPRRRASRFLPRAGGVDRLGEEILEIEGSHTRSSGPRRRSPQR